MYAYTVLRFEVVIQSLIPYFTLLIEYFNLIIITKKYSTSFVKNAHICIKGHQPVRCDEWMTAAVRLAMEF